MLSLLLGAAVAASPVPFSKDPDVRCLGAYLVAAGELKNSASASPEGQAGVQSIIMYFLGKLSGRRPESDLRGEVTTLVGSPGYSGLLAADVGRCSNEALERAEYVSSFGKPTEAATTETAPAEPAEPAAAKP